MMQRIDESDIEGKTIKEVKSSSGNYLVIFFTDHTYCSWKATISYGEPYLECEDLAMWEKRDTGIITQMEYDEYQKREQEKERERSKEYRRREYEQLKKEFEV